MEVYVNLWQRVCILIVRIGITVVSLNEKCILGMHLSSDDSCTYPPYNQRRVHTEYALLIWQPEVSAYSVCTLLWLYGGYVRKSGDYSYVDFIVCTSPSANYNGMCIWYKRSYATGRYELKVAASAALVHCSRAPAELSSSALVPPCCSLSLYYVPSS